MKVLFIINGLQYSGAEIVLERYLKDNEKIKPIFALLNNNSDLKNRLERQFGIGNVYTLNIEKNNFINKYFPMILSKLFWKKIKTVISITKPEVVYANNSTEAIYASFKKSPLPLVVHIHDMVSSIRNPLRRYGIKRAVKNSNEVITVSKAAKYEINRNDVSVVYNGLENSYFVNNDTKITSFNRSSQPIKIGFIGSFIQRKGPDLLLEAINILSRNGTENIELYIATNYIDEKLYQKCLRKWPDLEKKLVVRKNLNEIQIKDFLSEIDFLVVPSRRDPLPTVVMEAMAMNKIVIGSKVDGIPEMIKQPMLLFESNNPRSLVNSILNVINSDEKTLNTIIQELNSRAQKHFNDRHKKEKVNKILEKLTK
ncbi:glycosyltransferase family 4 protein [Halobacillus sp. BBL2006]|uniref:glycosyltransferase family 4 protein n=1 Tax=Halobacillus sp. BBL2006 TaxID=1543706 RepID=UPI0005422916|nr:glycosyltransferase family 4 protein [Halobacillus sp. BBL2006]KHE71455.1 hypothetical protein LD39_09705 [Halobacillus sp. BBL2006]